ncbi:Mitochondrial distribution and morphology protein 34 [Podosphaera aphanis]|nr:Mitochondrial distribution and morphology protein 34 [Podosphaera aphanis]
MAFNFNWSPLMADANFYQRAQEMLTTALNKSPKPPIIVGDILVNELNLGSIPPELEILEIGDLAEDRFRGIFKMCYSGDAFLTLKTRVQANPMNTYLSSKPSFTSPKPLAAASGLTIPLQISLSEIKLSAFIILVFSKQKGLTLVFRNDPLESLKVSSTFDSIPFVRNYLQKEIEMQLRTLMMDELPAIIHRLSLRLWCPEHVTKEIQAVTQQANQDETKIDPFASPTQDAVDLRGNIVDASEISSLSLDGSSEIHLLFSQKNLLRLAALSHSHQTLSLFTPSISDAVFRAWACPLDRGETLGTITPGSPSLARSYSTDGSTSTTYTFNRSCDDGYIPGNSSPRPSIACMPSITGLSLGSSRNSRSHLRKKKTRIVNLRKDKDKTQVLSQSENFQRELAPARSAEPDDNIITPPQSPSHRVRFRACSSDNDKAAKQLHFSPPTISSMTIEKELQIPHEKSMIHRRPRLTTNKQFSQYEKLGHVSADLKTEKNSDDPNRPLHGSTPSMILKQAWVLKMANELVGRAQDEKFGQGPWSSPERTDAPPAYEANLT